MDPRNWDRIAPRRFRAAVPEQVRDNLKERQRRTRWLERMPGAASGSGRSFALYAATPEMVTPAGFEPAFTVRHALS